MDKIHNSMIFKANLYCYIFAVYSLKFSKKNCRFFRLCIRVSHFFFSKMDYRIIKHKVKYNVWLRVSELNFRSTFYLHIKILFQDLDFPMTSLELDFEWNWDRRYLSYFTNDDWRMIFLFAEKIFWTPKFAIIMAIQKSHFCV